MQTQRLLLRDFRSDDYEAIYSYAADPEVTRQMFYGPRDGADTREYLARVLTSQTESPRLRWELAVVDLACGQLVGACDLTLDNEREADLGYIFRRQAWGRGYATEAARAMVHAGFQQLLLERIYGVCEVSHAASRGVLAKAGLRWVQTVSRYREAKGRWWDVHVYEVRRADWDDGK
jgi:RimJ/RimL family protein N-acetyltransferase